MFIWFLFGFMCALVLLLGVAYLKFVSLNNAVKQAWLHLDINLKNRAELIPSLALSAASFDELERPFIYSLTELKDSCRTAPDIHQRVLCEQDITNKFKKVFTAAAKHDELKKDEHFLKLQRSIIHAEGKVQNSKRKYNSAVRDFNTLAEVIPLNLIAKMFEFEKFEYFDFDNSLDKVM